MTFWSGVVQRSYCSLLLVDGSVVRLAALSASIGAFACTGSMAPSQTIGAEVFRLDVAQPLRDGVGCPFWAEVDGCFSG